ncbi:MAG: glycosyl transferase [Parcubacteria group bacterium Gr01-1014_49]|nr:MAG: glycosyl transferase [Parcubacteria group bacterium Gr01-1014_49]
MSKKIFDFFGALVLLVLTAPLFPLIALWIKATSPGPVMFRQIRPGHRGVPFTLFKFRTLIDGTGRPLDTVLPGDQRVTAPGRFLRKTHMDELPQLINVLLGQMSLIGPRPFSIKQTEARVREIPSFARRLDILPGITGLAQIRGRKWLLKRGLRCMSRLDLFYVDHERCLGLNLYILFKTVEIVLRGKGV